MNIIDKKLIENYTIVVMGNRMRLEDVPDREIVLDDGTISTLRQEVEIGKAMKEIEILEAILSEGGEGSDGL